MGTKLKERYRRREEWQSAAADKPVTQSPLSPLFFMKKGENEAFLASA
ncbi:MAG: hypothetical protein N3E52_06845 [Candidatus Bathyarchaeota archaeon]|nr:hypothetical protein [Candidatus Bathyarchaeota archaeon]